MEGQSCGCVVFLCVLCSKKLQKSQCTPFFMAAYKMRGEPLWVWSGVGEVIHCGCGLNLVSQGPTWTCNGKFL